MAQFICTYNEMSRNLVPRFSLAPLRRVGENPGNEVECLVGGMGGGEGEGKYVTWRSCQSDSRCFKKAIGRENVTREWLLSVFKAI